MRYFIFVALVSGCSSFEMPTPQVYPSSCPRWDERCERNFNAQTLYYIGQEEAARELMCLNEDLKAIMSGCGDTFPVVY